MSTIALLTDFGIRDWYVASMKATMLSINPEATFVDISHQIKPGQVQTASFVLEQCFREFPAATLFACVVDPGVGTARKPIAVKTPDYTFVGPDNGLFSFLLNYYGETDLTVRALENPYYLKELKGHTFHGRDIFAPATAHLASGCPFEKMGSIVQTMLVTEKSPPEFKKKKIRAQVDFIDHFGNIITNINKQALEAHWPKCEKVVLGKIAIPLRQTFGDQKAGDPVAYFGSGDKLEIAINQGNAAQQFGILPGQDLKLKQS